MQWCKKVYKLLNFPIASHKIPCYTINNGGAIGGKMRKTFLFMDTIINKVDAKGRVSLPSDYRAIVKELSTEIVCYRSLTAPLALKAVWKICSTSWPPKLRLPPIFSPKPKMI